MLLFRFLFVLALVNWAVGAEAQPSALTQPRVLLPVGIDSTAVLLPPELVPAVAAMQQGEYALAAEELQDIVARLSPAGAPDSTAEMEPGALVAMRLLAAVYMRMDALDAAIGLCRRISRAEPLDASSQVALGYLHYRRGELDTAAAHYRQALQRLPDGGEAYVGLGWIHLKRRELEEAMSMATAASERSPDDPVNAVLIGRILTAQGFYQDAADSYRRAFRLSPSLRTHYGILLQELILRHRLSDR